MRFKSLVEGQVVEFRGRLDQVESIKDWADGSRSIRFLKAGVYTRKANVLLSSV